MSKFLAVVLVLMLALMGCSEDDEGGKNSSDPGYLAVLSADDGGNAQELWVYDIANSGELSNLPDSPYAPGFEFPVNLAVHPSAPFVYVVDEDASALRAFTLNTDGELAEAPGSPVAFSTLGTTALDVSRGGDFLFLVTNDDGGLLETYAVDATTGALTDLGLAIGTGSGASGIAVNPEEDVLYAALTNSSSAQAYAVGTDGSLSVLGAAQQVNLGSLGASAPVVSPDGKYLYMLDTQTVEVVGFKINANGSVGAKVGDFALDVDPTAIAMDPNGKYLYVSEASEDQVWVLRINASTGALSNPTGAPTAVSGGPVSMTFTPDGELLFMGMMDTGQVRAFSVDLNSGALSEVAGSPFDSGVTPLALRVIQP